MNAPDIQTLRNAAIADRVTGTRQPTVDDALRILRAQRYLVHDDIVAILRTIAPKARPVQRYDREPMDVLAELDELSDRIEANAEVLDEDAKRDEYMQRGGWLK